MFKKPTKKQFLIRRILLSVLATVSVVIIVTVLILFMLGYRLDGGNGRLEQGALLQFNSTPDAAQVWIDGTYIGSQTATKKTVIAGDHSIKLTKSGYEDWNRTLGLSAGTLTWLDYIRLVPQQRTPKVVDKFSTLVGMKFSSDLKWALAQEVATVPTFKLIDIRSTDIKSTSLTIDPAVYSESATPDVAHTFAMHQWSSGGRYALIKHTFGAENKIEWLMLDTQDIAKSLNVTNTLNVELKDVKFATNSGTSLFGLSSDGVIRKLDVIGGVLSRGLITNVKSFTVYEENSLVSYVGTDQSEPAKAVAGIYKDGDSAVSVLRSVEGASTPLSIAIGRYFGDDYVAISENTELTILIGSLPSATQETNTLRQYAQMNLRSPTTSLSFSPKSDFVLTQSGADFMTYEIEHQRSSTGTIATAEGKDASRLKWLDIGHLWNDDNGSLVMRDFDGTNAHSIMSVEPGFGTSLSQNGRFFYGVSKAADGTYQLQRVQMILS